MASSVHRRAVRLALIGATCLSGFAAAPALAQQAPAAAPGDTVEEVVVTGFRKSLADATNAKRESVAFTDSVFAEDIGKFPDLNIAESLNRIPGIQLTREINGDGLNIAIRGLGTNFTKVLLNGSQIAVASSGRTDSQNQNREVDLNLFPTELFTRLDVSKTPMASQVEGGVAGVVNMRNARPLDRAGRHFTYSLQGSYQDSSGKWSPRGAVMASDSWDTNVGEFGLLVGYAGARSKSRTDGFETIGWTNANLTYAQCGVAPPAGTLATAPAPSCNTSGGNGFKWADTVAAGSGNGLVAGTPVTAAYLASLNPGTTVQQLGDAILPRLGRQSYSAGSRDRDSVLVSGEYRPNDDLAFYLDVLMGKTVNDFNRLDMDWIVRNSNGMVPIGVTVDSSNVVTKGTFANAQFFLEARPYHETTDFYNVNPGGSWQITPWLKLDGQFNLSRSVFFREAPTILVNTPAGLTVNFDNTSGDFPSITTAANLNDPNLGWQFAGGRLNIQNEKRVTSTKGTHWNLKIGESNDNYIKVGVAYDDVSRSIQALDNSGRWQAFTCGGGLDANGNVPTPAPSCNGQAGSAITQGQLASFLRPGPLGFITVDYDAFKAASQFDRFNDSAPAVASAATAASSGFIAEKTSGAYVEANAVTQILDRDLAINFGGRYASTDQTIRGPQTVNGVTTILERDTRYDAFLPSFNAVYKLTGDINLRMAASRTLTRPNPSAMLPGTTFSDPSAQNANQGNPSLAPYTANNFDVGGEWYTGGAGYVGVAAFQKVVNGFTVQGTNTIPFNQLGVAYDTLTALQQQAITNRGGPDVATVTVTQQVNAGGTLTIRGYELNWVQPLDFIFPGIGFTANYTRVNQTGSGSGAPAVAIGISPYTYNLTGYYEGHGATVRLSYNYNDAQVSSDPNQNSLPTARLRTDAYKQMDLSASYQLPWKNAPMITFNAINITSSTQRQTFEYPNAAFTFYDPGPTYLIGIRGQF
ncbi:TonB-dependent receptor [Caulobacter sp. AP07]|uniref:TonB-dependent receptor n=1 Tax=Caulobacter sp. AP07 TaxID=1144304 RepID=UPI000271F2F0|nr:TonB-dependent receptor [Caulobacter sp. AP07]EJL25787.1 TonB-dependent receptor [Caulobacter sp. AP07]